MELHAASHLAMIAADPLSPELLLWATQHVWLLKNKVVVAVTGSGGGGQTDTGPSLGSKTVDIWTSMLV